MKSTIQKMAAKLLRTKHLAIALAATGVMTAFPILAHAQNGPFTPKKVFLFNANPEVDSATSITVAGPLTVKVEDDERLVIDYSSVGAIEPPGANPAAPKAVLFLGCFIDGTIPCVGTQDQPSGIPLGWVNVLSCDFTFPITCAGWDSAVDHVWYTDELQSGTHTVTIKAAVGHFLKPGDAFVGNPGVLFDEARNLVVTVLAEPNPFPF